MEQLERYVAELRSLAIDPLLAGGRVFTTISHVGVLEALARHYLTNETISTGEISFLLGYADPSSFYRAFRDWTGLSPDRVRVGTA